MAKLTVTESAAPVHVDQKPKFTTIQDSRGRTIQLRKLDPLQKSRVVMAVGGELSANQVYMGGFALPAASVVFIDDVGFGLPQTIKQIDSMLAELGQEGMEAIENHFMEENKAAEEKAQAEASAAALSAEQAAAKN